MRMLHTERLLLRELDDLVDAQFVLELHRSPELARFIPAAVLSDLDGAHAAIARFRAGAEEDRGWWCVTRQDGQQVAMVLLKPIRPSVGSERRDVEVGWRQHPDHGGRGYATEAARAVLELGLTTGLERVVAVVDPQNRASQRVCHRLGMTDLGQSADYYDQVLELFERRPGPDAPSSA